LEQIYQDWKEEVERPTKLAELLKEDGLLGQFMLEAMVHLNYNLIKQKGYDQKLTE
jgi:hypothetical protein